jgi:hypothetical protein
MPPPRQSSLVLMNNATTPILAHQGNVVSRQSGHRTDESIEAPRSRLVACATVHRGRQKRTFRAPVAICSPILCPWGTGTDRHASRRGRPSGGGNGVPIARVKTPSSGATLVPTRPRLSPRPTRNFTPTKTTPPTRPRARAGTAHHPALIDRAEPRPALG